MAYLREVGQGLRRAGDFVKRHAHNVGKGLVTAAAVGLAAYGAMSHDARERSSAQRYEDNRGNMEWMAKQPMERVPHRDGSRYGTAGMDPPPSFVVPVKY
jgi:hypothetical protein